MCYGYLKAENNCPECRNMRGCCALASLPPPNRPIHPLVLSVLVVQRSAIVIDDVAVSLAVVFTFACLGQHPPSGRPMAESLVRKDSVTISFVGEDVCRLQTEDTDPTIRYLSEGPELSLTQVDLNEVVLVQPVVVPEANGNVLTTSDSSSTV